MTQLRILALISELKATHLEWVDKSYMDYDLWSTILAMHSYLELMTANPTGAPGLWGAVYNSEYRRRDVDRLLTASRKALYCVENNDLNRLAKSLCEMRAAESEMGYVVAENFSKEHILPTLAELLQFLL